MLLYPFGKKLNALTDKDFQVLQNYKSIEGIWVLGRNGNVGYVQEYDKNADWDIRIRWMHGGASHGWLTKLALEVLTPDIKQSPMPETVYKTEVGLDWHPLAANILKAGSINFAGILDYDQRSQHKAETLGYLKAIGMENDVFLITTDNGCEIAIYDQTQRRCCEERFFETSDDMSSLIGELFLKLEIVDVESPEDYIREGRSVNEVTEQTFIKLQTNSESVTLNCYNVQNGCYSAMQVGVCAYIPHPTLDRANTPFIRSPEEYEHDELVYNLNTLVKRLGIQIDHIDRG